MSEILGRVLHDTVADFCDLLRHTTHGCAHDEIGTKHACTVHWFYSVGTSRLRNNLLGRMYTRVHWSGIRDSVTQSVNVPCCRMCNAVLVATCPWRGWPSFPPAARENKHPCVKMNNKHACVKMENKYACVKMKSKHACVKMYANADMHYSMCLCVCIHRCMYRYVIEHLLRIGINACCPCILCVHVCMNTFLCSIHTLILTLKCIHLSICHVYFRVLF